MSNLFENHIVGFPTRKLILYYNTRLRGLSNTLISTCQVTSLFDSVVIHDAYWVNYNEKRTDFTLLLCISFHVWWDGMQTSDGEFTEKFRVTRVAFQYLVDSLHPVLGRKDTPLRKCITNRTESRRHSKETFEWYGHRKHIKFICHRKINVMRDRPRSG